MHCWWCFNLVWCMGCYSCNSTHTCNQWEFNTCNAKVPCMLMNPKTKTWPAMQWASSTSSLLWLSQATRTRKKLFTSPFPTGPHESEFSPHFTLFSLKERARKLSWVFSQTHGQHLKRKRKLHTISSSYSLKETTKLKDSLNLSTSHIFKSSH